MSSPGIPQAPLAPPPPPPPPVPGQVPALRINTTSEYGPRKTAFNGPQDPYEPPAAIQNAMMTKDKKPFTYTPGMGGKLDLSQIRSPRMARRVAKNANDEGIEGPPKSALAQEPRSPGSQPQTPSIYSHPQVAIPVFPQNVPQQPTANLRSSALAPRSPPVIERQPDPAPPSSRPVVKVETRLQPAVNSIDNQQQQQQQSPSSPPTSPTQVTLTKAPTPWMQKQVKQQEELPEWARRTNVNRQDSSSGSESSQNQPPPQQQPRQIVVVNTSRSQPQSQPQQQMRPNARQEAERVVPLRIEDRPSVFAALNESGHHQLSNSTPHHQSRWGNPVGQSAYSPGAPQGCAQGGAQGGARLIPIQVEGQSYQAPNNATSPTSANHNQSRNVPRGQMSNQQQTEPGPVQSNSFRVLQKITGTDADQVDEEQMRKLNLTEDDRFLMNKFKEQVDGEGMYLHKEEDPRYRGAAIPSRAFRYLQNMTDSGDAPNANTTAPRPVNPATKKQNRNSNNFEETPTVYVPASEQQVPEPKKYMGSAIPSRSFRILQAMTAPESIATQENRRDSATDCVKMPDNQQATYPNSRIMSTNSISWDPKLSYDHYYPESDNNDTHDNDSHKCKVNNDDNNGSTITAFDDSFSKNSTLYAESQMNSSNISTTSIPTILVMSATVVPVQPDVKEREHFPLSVSLLSPAGDSESEKEDTSSKRKGDDAKNESDSSSHSESRMVYSTRMTAQNQQRIDTANSPKERETEESNNETIDKNESSEDDERNKNKITSVEDERAEERNEQNNQEDSNEITISVNLPLKRQSSLSDKKTSNADEEDENVETFVAFTLKRPNNHNESVEETIQVQPRFIISSSTDDDKTEDVPKETECTNEDSTRDKRQALLTVKDNSKEEITDDEDSGVTSDMSRIISEVDSDSEGCQTSLPINSIEDDSSPSVVTKRTIREYNRAQTHSRLFKLLTDGQLREPKVSSRLPSHSEEYSSPSSGLTSADCNQRNCLMVNNNYHRPRYQLPARPKSLDCEVLFKNNDSQDKYFETTLPISTTLTRPRVNVYCPRIRSTINSTPTLRLKPPSPFSLSSTRLSSKSNNFNIPNPVPVRTSWRC